MLSNTTLNPSFTTDVLNVLTVPADCHSGFKQAVARFLTAEERGIDEEANHITMASPFKRGDMSD